MNDRDARLLVLVVIVGGCALVAATASPVWLFGVVIGAAGLLAAALNPNLPAATSRERPALEGAGNVAGAVMVAVLGVAAAIAAGNPVLGIAAVIASGLLLGGLWVTRDRDA